MRRTATVLALSTALLAPAPAFAQETPSPSPQQTPHMDCGPVIEPFESPVPAWGLDGNGDVTLVIKGHPNPEERKGTEIVVVGYVRPSTETKELGRAPVDEDGKARVVLRLTGSTRLSAYGGGCFFSSMSTVVPVEARLGGLHAHRNGPRDYTFSTFYAGPAGKIGNLYRVLSDGRQVLTSQTRMSPEFVRIRRAFLGSGRFGFVLRTGDDVNSLGASTNVRDTVIH